MRKETRHLLAWSKSFNVLDHKNAETFALTLKEQIHGHQSTTTTPTSHNFEVASKTHPHPGSKLILMKFSHIQTLISATTSCHNYNTTKHNPLYKKVLSTGKGKVQKGGKC
jgi:hypothetical protein